MPFLRCCQAGYYAVLLASACTIERHEPVSQVADGPVAFHPAGFRVSVDSEIPDGPLGASIRRGRAILLATGDSLPDFVGNALRCASCHLDSATRPFAAPWVGVYSRFPQYRSRNGKVNVIQDRINDCFQRSLNGKPLPAEGRDVRDLIAYMAFLSRGVAAGDEVPGQGFSQLELRLPDRERGGEVYRTTCAVCHGDEGQGTVAATPAPPLWGERSYSVGAGMARLRTAAAFIHRNMPFDRPGTLTEQQAFDVAAFVNDRPRPDFPGKENDWPNGDPPPDVAYPTRAASAKAALLKRMP
jgi:thiosulfate dehydrogenase